MVDELRRPLGQTGKSNTFIVLGIVAAFIVAGVAVWAYWNTREGDENSRDAASGLVQPAQVPEPRPALPAQHADPAAPQDPTGDATARGRERENVPAA